MANWAKFGETEFHVGDRVRVHSKIPFLKFKRNFEI